MLEEQEPNFGRGGNIVAGNRNGVLSTPNGGGVEDRLDVTPGLYRAKRFSGLSRLSGGASGHWSSYYLAYPDYPGFI